MAIERLKNNGFKVDGHLMPDLPFSSADADAIMFQKIFESEEYGLDYVKIYPCLSLPFTTARRWKEDGQWQPYVEKDYPLFVRTLAEGMARIPPWTRVNRVQRDFPKASEKNGGLGYESNTIRTNLHQLIREYMMHHNLPLNDIRSREIKRQDLSLEKSKLWIRSYRASGAEEFFISIEKDNVLFGFVRLRLPPIRTRFRSSLFPFLRKERIGRIRELHVYGYIAGTHGKKSIQHRGIGGFLMRCAEEVASFYSCKKVAVISGVGVRRYYQNLGYRLEKNSEGFMLKSIRISPLSILSSPFFTISSMRMYYGLYYGQTQYHSGMMIEIIGLFFMIMIMVLILSF
jgi:ELP3 family radical SAM enzyme/protein acetyltransferase